MLRQPANLDVLFKFATRRQPDRRPRRGDLGARAHAADQPQPAARAAGAGRSLLPAEVLRGGAQYLEGALKSPSVPPEVRDPRRTVHRADRQPAAGPRTSMASCSSACATSRTPISARRPRACGCSARSPTSTSRRSARPDWGVVSTMQLRHTYDFGTQDKATLETFFTGYSNRQFQVSAANVSLLDLTIGPRFQVFSSAFEDITRQAAVRRRRDLGERHALLWKLGRRRRSERAAVGPAAQHLDRGVAPAQQPGHDLPADQQPVPRHRILVQHGLPVRAHADRLGVRQRQRPALPVRPGAVAELHAVGYRRRHELPLRRSGAQDRPALDRQPDRQRAVVALRCARPDDRPQRPTATRRISS